MMPVAHHPAASATKFSGAYSHQMIAGGIGLLPQEQAFTDAVLQAGGSRT
jgi:hypothetical protein